MDGIAFYLGFRSSYRIYAVWCPAITVVYSPDEDNDDAISESDDNDAAVAAAKNDSDDSNANNTNESDVK